MRAPLSGWLGANSSRMAIRPGISVSAMRISLRPQAARPMSAMAVDSALMVIDAANGVEAQTRRLIEVCRQRDTPIITFVNKMDREVRDPLDILDEVERELGMPCCPMTWPVGQGKSFGGIIDLRTQSMTVFEPGSEKRPQDFEVIPLSESDKLRARFGQAFDDAMESMELAVGASTAWSHEQFLAAKLTPVFFGSGVNNFGVMEVLNAVVDMSPPPGPRIAYQEVNRQREEKTIQPEDEGFSAWSSRCRPTWTPTTATASPSCAWPRASTPPA
jgi:peptide chain release factor 3